MKYIVKVGEDKFETEQDPIDVVRAFLNCRSDYEAAIDQLKLIPAPRRVILGRRVTSLYGSRMGVPIPIDVKIYQPLERYIFEFPGREEYEVDEELEVIKKMFKSARNGTVPCSLENAREIMLTHLNGRRIPLVVGENLHTPVYTLPIEYTVSGRTLNDFVHVYEARSGVGVKNEKTKS